MNGVMTGALWFGGWMLAAYGAGIRITGEWIDRKRPGGELLSVITAVALGLVLLELWMIAGGTAGLLSKTFAAIFLSAGAVSSVLILLRRRPAFGESARLAKALYAGILFLAILTFLASMTPPVGSDALSYHLVFPKLHATAGHLVYASSHPRTLWPYFMGMLATAGLLTGGQGTATLFSWLMTPMTILAVPAAAAYFTRNRKAAVASLLMIASVPALWMQSIDAYTDTAMMFFAFMVFVSLGIWRERSWDFKSALMTGLFLGALASVKYFTLICAFILTVLFWSEALLRRPRTPVKIASIAISIATAVVTAGFWYVRSWVVLGNPVFPFAHNLFGGNGFSQRMVGYAELPKTWINALMIPWNTAFKPDAFGGEPLGCVFLAALPLVFFWRRLPGLIRIAGIYAVLSLIAWYLLIQHARFFFTVVPFLALFFGVAAAAWHEGLSRRLRKPFLILITIVFVMHAGVAAYYPSKRLPVMLGKVSEREYLVGNERSSAFFDEIRQKLDPARHALLFMDETRLYYSPVRWVHYGRTVDRLMKKRNLSWDQWLVSEGVTHFLTSDRVHEGTDWRERLLPGHTPEREVKEIHRKRVSFDDKTWDYVLWQLAQPE